MVYEDNALRQVTTAEGRRLYAKAEEARKALVSQLEIVTPDPYMNTLGGALMAAATAFGTERCGFMVQTHGECH